MHRAREVRVERIQRAELLVAQKALIRAPVPRLWGRVCPCLRWRHAHAARGDEAVRVRDHVRTVQLDDVRVHRLARRARGAGPRLCVQDERGDGHEGLIAVPAWAGEGARLVD